MQIRYRNTIDHLIALQKYVLRNTDTGKMIMLHRFLAVEAIIVFIMAIFAINHNRFKVLLGFAIVSCLAWLFRERTVLLQFRKDFTRERRKDKTGQFDKERIFDIAPSGVTIRVGAQQTRYTWDQVERSGQDRKHVYVVLKGVLHYVIPISAFTDPNEVALFLETIAAYRAAP